MNAVIDENNKIQIEASIDDDNMDAGSVVW